METYLVQKDLAKASKISNSNVTTSCKKLNLKGEKIGNFIKYAPNEVRRFFETGRGFKYTGCKKICFLNLKGGVGKTSLAASLGYSLSQYGARVLLIDFDIQGNLSQITQQYNDELPTWKDVVSGDMKPSELILPAREYLDVITCNLGMSTIDRIIGSKNVATLVSQYLEELMPNYEFIIFDTHPEISNINMAATLASNIVYLPAKADMFSLKGIEKMLEELKFIENEYSLYLPKEGIQKKIIINMFKSTRSTELEFFVGFKDKFGDLIDENVFNDSADLAAACSKNMFAVEYKRNSPMAKQFQQWSLGLLDFQAQKETSSVTQSMH